MIENRRQKSEDRRQKPDNRTQKADEPHMAVGPVAACISHKLILDFLNRVHLIYRACVQALSV